MRKLFYLGISLVLALTMLAPSAAVLAKAPPSVPYASGTVTNIDEGDVAQVIFDSEDPYGFYWDVKDRQVDLTLSGRSVKGNFVLIYDGIFFADQSGSLSGVMKGNHKEFAVTGDTQGLIGPVGYAQRLDGTWGPECILAISGDWKGIKGTRSAGTFTGSIHVVLDATYQHIDSVISGSSSFVMNLNSHGEGDDGDGDRD